MSENVSSPAGDEAVKADEAARAQAEARRKRILEESNTRLGVVSGEIQASNETEQKKTNASNAARIRAARQRRYGKKSATPIATTTAEAIAEIAKEAEIDDKESKIENAATVETTEVEAAPTIETSADVDTKTHEAPEVTTTSGSDEVTTAVTSEKKKKYMGVAKMRRKMIAKKKLEEEEEEVTTETTMPGIAATNVTSSVGPHVEKVMATQSSPKLPIYMHIVIVLLLFLAGLDVGIQQFHDDVVVHTETAIHEYGLPFVQRKPWEPLVRKDRDGNRSLEEELLFPHESKTAEMVDEFGEVPDDDEYVPNIDPLFRVDLDELTRGPGILNQLARGAIAVHRMILWLLYYTPINVINTVLAIPMALIKMPPALFLIALVLRQIVGKVILGAHIPEKDSPEDKNNIELIGMAKNFVKSFFATNFPTLTWAYNVFVHLRSDMYIVLCGVFCGMAWSHLTAPVVNIEGSVQDGYPGGGMTDEL
jgi:hypothetical protein